MVGSGLLVGALVSCGSDDVSGGPQTSTGVIYTIDDTATDPVPTDSAPPPAPLNVLVVLVDTLRADHLELYGHTRDTAPRLRAWAEQAVVFEEAITASPWTLPSVASIFTGLYVSAHEVRDFGDGLATHHVTLAERFRDAGYRTAALMKTGVLVGEAGFEQGFDTWEADPDFRDSSAQDLTDRALAWLDAEASDPFLLYLHYTDPHYDYIAPEPYYESHAAGIDSELTGGAWQIKEIRDGERELLDGDIDRLLALYDGEITYWDSQLGRLLDHLEASGLADQTLVVLTSDHGEQFHEHGNWFHTKLYQQLLHVPLVVSGPGLVPRRVPGVVRTVDLAPTLAGRLGLEPVAWWQGHDLGGALDGGAVPAEPAYFEYTPGSDRGIQSQDRMKFFVEDKAYHFFDLEADPAESENLNLVLVDERVALYEEMMDLLEQSQDLARDLAAAAASDTGS